MINNLVQRFQTLDNGLSQVNELIEKLATTFQADPPVLHDFYRYWFGLIDKHDKKWYKTVSSHYVHSWRLKFFFALMRSSFINVHSLCNVVFQNDLLDLRKSIALKCLEITPKTLQFYSILPK
jgi:hypothetical protein